MKSACRYNAVFAAVHASDLGMTDNTSVHLPLWGQMRLGHAVAIRCCCRNRSVARTAMAARAGNTRGASCPCRLDGAPALAAAGGCSSRLLADGHISVELSRWCLHEKRSETH